MKKLAFLFLVVLLATLSANTFAQSSGTAPAPGASHTYTVTQNGSNTYTWTVTRGDLTTSAGTAATITGSGNSISIEWADTVTLGVQFYVHVVEDDGSCTNEKVLPVLITASPFYVAISGATTSCYDGDVSVSLSGTNPQYDHGDATITYTVTPAGVNAASDGYSFNFVTALSQFSSSVSATSSNGSMTGTLVEVDDDQPVTIELVVSSTVLTNSTDSNGTAADVTATNTISNGETGNGVSDNGTGTKSVVTTVSRPHTTTIGTN